MQTTLAVSAKLVLHRFQPVDQVLSEGRPAHRAAQGIEFQADIKLQLIKEHLTQRDQFGIHLRFHRADDFRIKLMKLAQPSLLWPLMAEHRTHGV